MDDFNLSRDGYRKVRKGVKKRINGHMHELSYPNMARYLDLLRTCKEANYQCELLLTVSISRYFRDRRLWTAIEKKILPNLFNTKTSRIK